LLHEELSPEFKKELNDKNIETAKKQLVKKYQGFRMDMNSRWGNIYYVKNGKVIVTDYERGFNNTIILSHAGLEKWTYPDDKYLTPAETSEMQKDLKEFEEKEKLVVEF